MPVPGSFLARFPVLAAPAVLAAFSVLAAAAVVASPLSAQSQADRLSSTSPSERYRIPGVRVERAPAIDGALDEDVWRQAAVIEEFIQQEPREGRPATERTEVRVLYDEANLYIGVRAFDSSPDGVVATEMRRDADRILQEDNFQVILDTFGDHRSAYMFVVTPLGARLDQQVFDEGGRSRRSSGSAINRDWDGVWSVSARETGDGWIAEIAIPMVTLRFPEAEPQSWGLNFMRNIRRKNEQVFWAPIPQAYGLTRVSLAGSLNDLESLNRGYDLRVKPYATGGGRRESLAGDIENSTQGDVGLDLKYGVTASLNLDVTVNTDFAQAEVDDEQVNLTRFPLFFPEKREFFLENAGQFTVGTSTSSVGRIADLFFSRRIGLTPAGEEIPILGGARLTGKVGANNIAVMDLQTDEAFGNPSENFFVARYSRDVLDRSQIGGLVVNKEATGGDHFNRTFAADATLALTPALTVNGFVAGTSSPGVSESEHGAHFRAGWLDRSWRVYTEHTDLGDNFNPEVGFVPRVGIRRSKFHLEYNPRPDRWGIRMMEPMANVTYFTDQTGRLVTRQFHYMLGTRLETGAYINVWYNRYFERVDEPFSVATGTGVTVDAGDYRFGDWNFSFRSDPSRRFFYSVRYAPQTFFDGERTDVSASTGMRLTDQIATSVDFSRNDVDLPSGDFTADVGSLQLDVAFSPDMSLRTLTQYNSLTEQWSTSARFRYTYRPGSDLYVVYDDVRRDQVTNQSPLVERFKEHQLLVKMTYLFSF